jgi:hypothetical protein
MSALPADMPVKPRRPATIDITKKINAHFRSVTILPPALLGHLGRPSVIAG